MTKRLAAALLAVAASLTAPAQNIRDHYVSKAEEDGTIYHTLPRTLFDHPEEGDLTFDLTYKAGSTAGATFNLTTYSADEAPVDSLRLAGARLAVTLPAERLYAEPERRRWRHRTSCRVALPAVEAFFSEESPEVTLYTGGRTRTYRIKRSAWRSYAPAGRKIIRMIRANEE